MIEKLLSAHHHKESVKRTLVKTISYRCIILILDFTTIYLFTGQIKVAAGFTVVSNVYTTACYFFHERIWDRISWGKVEDKVSG